MTAKKNSILSFGGQREQSNVRVWSTSCRWMIYIRYVLNPSISYQHVSLSFNHIQLVFVSALFMFHLYIFPHFVSPPSSCCPQSPRHILSMRNICTYFYILNLTITPCRDYLYFQTLFNSLVFRSFSCLVCYLMLHLWYSMSAYILHSRYPYVKRGNQHVLYKIINLCWISHSKNTKNCCKTLLKHTDFLFSFLTDYF